MLRAQHLTIKAGETEGLTVVLHVDDHEGRGPRRKCSIMRPVVWLRRDHALCVLQIVVHHGRIWVS